MNSDLEKDLHSCPWIVEKVKNSESYAQNLYAALCNNQFIKNEVIDILKNEKWTCSWRYSGGIIADIRNEGDYMDWYCSGIRNTGDDGQSIDVPFKLKNYVSESVVTDEIREDLKKIGWFVVTDDDYGL